MYGRPDKKVPRRAGEAGPDDGPPAPPVDLRFCAKRGQLAHIWDNWSKRGGQLVEIGAAVRRSTGPPCVVEVNWRRR